MVPPPVSESSFTLTTSAYATPALLGGMNFQVLATMIYGQLLDFLNWPMASVLGAYYGLRTFGSKRFPRTLL